MLGSTLC